MFFLPETKLHKHGGIYEKAAGPFAVKALISGENGELLTGHNPPSTAVFLRQYYQSCWDVIQYRCLSAASVSVGKITS